jgi:hypothetical protein
MEHTYIFGLDISCAMQHVDSRSGVKDGAVNLLIINLIHDHQARSVF